MLKGYRGRFVAYNMALVGFVLALLLAALGVFLYQNERNELKKTMSLLIEPWDAPSGSFKPIDAWPPPAKPDGAGEPAQNPEHHAEIRPDDKKDRIARDDIVTVFYNTASGQISVLSNDTALDADTISEAVSKIAALDKNYGTLKTNKLIYCKERTASGYKIALADASYIASRTLRNALLLALVYFAALLALLPISVWLSRLAAKPMERAIEMERQFVADISHDLKTPITVVLANNSILRANQDETIRHESQWLDSTDAAAKNMLELVNEMLELSSLESVNKSVESTTASLSASAEKSVLQLESVAYDKNVALDSELSCDLYVKATPEYLDRITTGLIENAIKYEPDGGRITVTLSQAKKRAVFSVKNCGSVINKEDMPHIFERFYRGDKARSGEKGHGLGLPIIKSITELIGAELTVKSDERGGTVFSVSFEIAE